MAEGHPRGMPAEANVSCAECLVFAPYRLDARREQLWRGKQVVALKPKAFAVLRYLVENSARLVTKQELFAGVWGDVHVGDAALKAQLRDIRQALGDDVKCPRFIETAHRRGYRFVAPVTRVRPEVDETPVDVPFANPLSGFDAPAPPEGGAVSRREDPTAVLVEPAAAAREQNFLAGARLGTSDAFVGRQPELRRLCHELAQAMAGRRRLVFLSGQTGIGKTFLVRAFCEWLELQGAVRIAWGQCAGPVGACEPYLPLLEALGRMGRGAGSDALVSALRCYAPNWLPQLPGLRDRDTPFAALRAAPAPPERLLLELAEALEAFTFDKPLLLVLEDVHWADPASLAWLAYVARRADPARLLVLATCRPVEPEGNEHPLAEVKRELELQQRCSELHLASFSRDDVVAYLAANLANRPYGADLPDQLLARTAGNPLYLGKLVESLRQAGTLEPGESLDSAMPAALGPAMSAKIIDLINKQSERLTRTERDMLEAASAAGPEFSTASVAAALDADLVQVEDQFLRWARSGQFVRVQGDAIWPDGTIATRCEFIHVLQQQTLYTRIGAARQMRLHLAIARRHESAHGERAREIAATLAFHFERGQDYGRAVRYRGIVGQQAARQNDYKRAVVELRRGLELLERFAKPNDRADLELELELQLELLALLPSSRGFAVPEVDRTCARARLLCQMLDDTRHLVRLTTSMALHHLVKGEYQLARAVGGEFLARHGEHADVRSIRELGLWLAVADLWLGKPVPALEALQGLLAPTAADHAEVGELADDTGVLAQAFAGLTRCLLGFPDHGLQQVQEALAKLDQRNDASGSTSARASLVLILVLQLRGDMDAARARAEVSAAVCRKFGMSHYLHAAKLLAGASVHLEPGGAHPALMAMREAWQTVSVTGSELAGAFTCLWAQQSAAAGSYQAAGSVLSLALQRAEHGEEGLWAPELWRTLGHVIEQSGALPAEFAAGDRSTLTYPGVSKLALPADTSLAAELCFRRALDLARATQTKLLELRAAISLARHWRKRGRAPAAHELLSQAHGVIREGFATRDVREAAELLDALARGSQKSSAMHWR